MKPSDQHHRARVDTPQPATSQVVELTPNEDAALVNRRRFLEAAGFAVGAAVVTGCSRVPVDHAQPYVEQPDGARPGRMRYFATTCAGCSAGCGLSVGVRDGRPLKMEGLADHPLSRGGLCAVGQAIPLELYDSHRLTGPQIDGQDATWEKVDAQIVAKLKEVNETGRAVRLVTPTVTSPTLQRMIDRLLGEYKDAKHVVFDPNSCSAILDAHEQTHGVRVLPRYQFEQADVVVSLGADFLGAWISPVEMTASWSRRRVPDKTMLYHVQIESRVSVTGSNADRRLRLCDEDQALLLSHLATRIGKLTGKLIPAVDLAVAPIDEAQLDELVQRLVNAKSRSLVLCDSNDATTQLLVNQINHLLGNYDHTIDLSRHSRQRQGSDADVYALVEELKAGKVAVLLVAGVDLTHSLPQRDTLIAAIAKVPLVVSLATHKNDFAALAGYVCPDSHALETWSDVEAVNGLVGICQPTLRPLGNTRSVLESLAAWSGKPQDSLALVKETWTEGIFKRQKTEANFQKFWDQTLITGFAEVDPLLIEPKEFDASAVKPANKTASGDGYSVALYSKVGVPDPRHAQNPWLQELPDPVTKVTWDNYVSVSPDTAEAEDLSPGDVVQLTVDEVTLELPVHVQPGQHDQVLAVALHYGCPGTDRFAGVGPQWFEGRTTVGENGRVGVNAAELLTLDEHGLRYVRGGATLKSTGKYHVLATTQQHHRIEVPKEVAPHGGLRRDVFQDTTLAEFSKDPHAGKPEVHDFGDKQLWNEDHPKDGHAWGMVIDTNRCTGCSACLIACQSENNVPVVGRDEVRRQREMHWIRIDRYYDGDGDDMTVGHQPMMCHHCDNAPCETVCPMLATVHSEEGLNQMAYNRCVGTRYCANNCPYKVRRFNWFDYPHDDTLKNLALNPDVTVRMRGVMEKCSMCIQRIQDGKIEARRLEQELTDGTIQTACQQTCPANAIMFGDLNDPESAVHAAMNDPRRYSVLEELGIRPTVGYLRQVRNTPPKENERG